MKVCGIMIAKENSNRFPGKNRLLFEDNLNILIDVCGKNNTYMFSNDKDILKRCHEKEVHSFVRHINAIDDDQPYIDVIKFAYMRINDKDFKYDYIVSILANTINHDVNIANRIKSKIKYMGINKETTLMRSYNSADEQSGIFIFRTNNLPEKLYHEEIIFDGGSEIHYKEELE